MKHMRVSVIVGLLVACILAVASVPAASGEPRLINVNTASADELSALNGVGAVKAQAIVAYREKNGSFKSVDDLGQVKGIGEKILEKLRSQVTVGNGSESAAAPVPAAKR